MHTALCFLWLLEFFLPFCYSMVKSLKWSAEAQHVTQSSSETRLTLTIFPCNRVFQAFLLLWWVLDFPAWHHDFSCFFKISSYFFTMKNIQFILKFSSLHLYMYLNRILLIILSTSCSWSCEAPLWLSIATVTFFTLQISLSFVT